MTRPNIVLIMADQLGAPIHRRLWPSRRQNPEHGHACSNAACASMRLTATRLSARRARASFMAGQFVTKIGAYDNAAEFGASHPDMGALSARQGVYDLPFRQDAFCRPGPATRLRRTSHDRHLPFGPCLDPGLGKPGSADRQVVSQHGFGEGGGACRHHVPDRVRRRNDLHGPPSDHGIRDAEDHALRDGRLADPPA